MLSHAGHPDVGSVVLIFELGVLWRGTVDAAVERLNTHSYFRCGKFETMCVPVCVNPEECAQRRYAAACKRLTVLMTSLRHLDRFNFFTYGCFASRIAMLVWTIYYCAQRCVSVTFINHV